MNKTEPVTAKSEEKEKETELDSIEYRIAKRGEKIVLDLKKNLGRSCFRYAVAENEKGANGFTYSIYASYSDGEKKTVGSITDFSASREGTESFCRLLARMLATPLSLESIYEDSLTP